MAQAGFEQSAVAQAPPEDEAALEDVLADVLADEVEVVEVEVLDVDEAPAPLEDDAEVAPPLPPACLTLHHS